MNHVFKWKATGPSGPSEPSGHEAVIPPDGKKIRLSVCVRLLERGGNNVLIFLLEVKLFS